MPYYSLYTGDLLAWILPVLSLVVAVLAIFFGPLITLRISKKQFEVSRQVANKQIMALMRQAADGAENPVTIGSKSPASFRNGTEAMNESENPANLERTGCSVCRLIMLVAPASNRSNCSSKACRSSSTKPAVCRGTSPTAAASS